jgi:dolichyl-phosphate beta-glucosyltransferase
MLPETTIVMAAYNEEERLPETLVKIQAYLERTGEKAEVIVVDDGSADGTAAVVASFCGHFPPLRLISYARNRGKGYALRRGVLASRGSLILLTDADLSTPIEELDNLKPFVCGEGYHVAIGSRALPLSQVVQAQPPWRRAMGWLFKKLVRTLVIDGFSDTQCGFKLFSGDVARTLFREARIHRFAYDVEILALARKEGHRVAEVPVEWKNSAASTVRPVLDSLQMLADLIRIAISMASPLPGTDAAPIEELESESAN